MFISRWSEALHGPVHGSVPTLTWNWLTSTAACYWPVSNVRDFNGAMWWDLLLICELTLGVAITCTIKTKQSCCYFYSMRTELYSHVCRFTEHIFYRFHVFFLIYNMPLLFHFEWYPENCVCLRVIVQSWAYVSVTFKSCHHICLCLFQNYKE